MKNLPTILSGLALAIAIVALVLAIKPKQNLLGLSNVPDSLATVGTFDGVQQMSAVKGVVFVNIDSLFEHYNYFNTERLKLENTTLKLEQEMERKMKSLEAHFIETQKKAQNGQLTPTEIKLAEEDLQKRQRDIVEYRDNQQRKLVEQEADLTKQMYKQINTFLRDYCPRNGYSYVLGYTSTGGILYAADSLSITDAVIEGLNKNK